MNYAPTAWNASLAVVFLTIAGCVTVETNIVAESSIALVRLKPNPNMIALTAQLEGTLEVRNGCVYLISKKSGAAVLTIWPATYQLLLSNGKVIGVKDSLTRQSLQFGIISTLGGGAAEYISPSELDAPIPFACDGPSVYAYFSSK